MVARVIGLVINLVVVSTAEALVVVPLGPALPEGHFPTDARGPNTQPEVNFNMGKVSSKLRKEEGDPTDQI